MNNGFQSEVLIQINLFCKGRIFKSISSRGGESSKNVIYKETFFFRDLLNLISIIYSKLLPNLSNVGNFLGVKFFFSQISL